MFQFEDTSGLDDDPGGQSGGVRPRANRGRTMFVVAALVVVAGGGAAWRLAQHHHTVPAPEAAPTTLARPTESLPGPTETLPVPPVPAATDALVPTGGDAAGTNSRRMVVAVQLINDTTMPLTLTGPIRLLGPSGVALPHSTAKIVADSSAGMNFDTLPAAPALQAIAPRQHVDLVVTVSYDCRRDAGELSWSKHYPTIEIPVAGFDRPWTGEFDNLFGGLGPVYQGSSGGVGPAGVAGGESFLAQACAAR